MQRQFLQNTLLDDSTGQFPSAITFFLFQAGLHSEALDFLSKYPSKYGPSQLATNITSFGKLYSKYLDSGKCIRQSLIPSFISDYERLGIPNDMFLEALVHLMTGQVYREDTFVNVMLP